MLITHGSLEFHQTALGVICVLHCVWWQIIKCLVRGKYFSLESNFNLREIDPSTLQKSIHYKTKRYKYKYNNSSRIEYDT